MDNLFVQDSFKILASHCFLAVKQCFYDVLSTTEKSERSPGEIGDFWPKSGILPDDASVFPRKQKNQSQMNPCSFGAGWQFLGRCVATPPFFDSSRPLSTARQRLYSSRAVSRRMSQ